MTSQESRLVCTFLCALNKLGIKEYLLGIKIRIFITDELFESGLIKKKKRVCGIRLSIHSLTVIVKE